MYLRPSVMVRVKVEKSVPTTVNFGVADMFV